MKKYLGWKLLTILIVTLVLGVFDLPASVQSKILPFSSETLSKAKISLGLDLQGGSQLDYKIDLRKVPMKLIYYKKMFLGTSQFGVFTKKKR